MAYRHKEGSVEKILFTAGCIFVGGIFAISLFNPSNTDQGINTSEENLPQIPDIYKNKEICYRNEKHEDCDKAYEMSQEIYNKIERFNSQKECNDITQSTCHAIENQFIPDYAGFALNGIPYFGPECNENNDEDLQNCYAGPNHSTITPNTSDPSQISNSSNSNIVPTWILYNNSYLFPRTGQSSRITVLSGQEREAGFISRGYATRSQIKSANASRSFSESTHASEAGESHAGFGHSAGAHGGGE